MLGDRVGGLARFGGEHRLGIGLGIILRPVTEPRGVRIVVPGAPVIRDAIDDLVSDIGMLEPDPRELMRPFPAGLMRMWPISTRVNKPENDDSLVVEPIELAPDAA